MKPTMILPLLFLMYGFFATPIPGICNSGKVDTSIVVPIGGNTWCKPCDEKSRTLNDRGIENWRDKNTGFETWIRVNQPGTIKLGIEVKTGDEATIELTVANKSNKLTVKNNDYKIYQAGEFSVRDTGYLKISMKGLQKKGDQFPGIKAYHLSGTAINAQTAFVKNNEGDFFYWGRRGPSVHLNYPFADSLQAEWFYNEITVPEKQDVVGSYFMANGFGEGYFGIQVNSLTERRILFSVWSPFSTDDPKAIPDSMRIGLLKKGEGVYTGEFGNEGSGGQSYLRYNWKAGTTYKFLLGGKPDGEGNTIYSAYFFEPEKNTWMLIASFKRPQTNTWLRRFHSFLENFIPAEGDKTRQVLFGNQWIRTNKGEWLELTKAVFTYDNTAAKGYRMDYAGGLNGRNFYLKNCGFFSEYTGYRSVFNRSIAGVAPGINFNKLP